MPPQKRSIKDFFAPAARADVKKSTSSTSQLSGPHVAPTPRERPPARSDKPQSTTTTQESTPPSPSYPALGDAVPISGTQSTPSDTRLPSTSQSSANSVGTAGASKRIVSNGEQVVLNSDSETDSLPDLDWGVPSNNTKLVTHHNTKLKHKEDVQAAGLRKPPKQRKNGKSFRVFVQTAQKNAEAEREIAEVKADLDKPLVEERQPVGIQISEETLADAVHDDEDPDKVRRLYQAMQRTNALQSESVFHFFDEEKTTSTKNTSPFPMRSIPDHRWTSNFQEETTRDQAFLSGFAQQVFRYQQLPEELASWLIDQVCTSPHDVLISKYIQLLEAHSHHLQVLLDKSRLDSIFDILGADKQNLDPLQQVTASDDFQPSSDRSLPTTLKSVCRLLQLAAPRIRTKASGHALSILFHLCMDHTVMSDIYILEIVQDTIEALIRNVKDNKKLASVLNETIPLLLTRITNPTLQRNLTCSLPTKSPLTTYFQRHLALSFLLRPTPLDVPLDSPELPNIIHTLLRKSPDFHVTKKTDYMSLAARLTLLDIAIGPGPLTVPYQPLSNPTTSDQDGSSPVTAPVPLSSEEKAFNKEVDSLAERVKLLSDSIVETGSLIDMSRLDAKDCSERLYHRLEHAVRIGGKKQKNMFREDEDGVRPNVLSKWLVRTKSNSRSQTPADVANRDEDPDGGSDASES